MSGTDSFTDFHNRFATEQICRDYLEQARWGEKITCPHCDSHRVYKFTDGRLYKCGHCRKQFTVRVGLIFEDSKLSLQKWFFAVYLATSLKKGISSSQLANFLGITQKSAWFMLQRLKYVFENDNSDIMWRYSEVRKNYNLRSNVQSNNDQTGSNS